MCREGVLEHIFDRLFLARENSTILIVELLLLEQLMGSSRDLIALVVYARGGRGRRQIEVGTTSTFVLREETGSPYASRLQVYSKIQDCMNFLLNMRAYSEFRCPLIFLRIVLYFQSDPWWVPKILY